MGGGGGWRSLSANQLNLQEILTYPMELFGGRKGNAVLRLFGCSEAMCTFGDGAI